MTNPHKDLDDFFTQVYEKKPPAARWGKIQEGDFCVKGVTEGGEILSIDKGQKPKFENGQMVGVEVWEDGKPRMQGIVIVQTTQVGVINAEDDGRRTFYIEGAMLKAVKEAIKEAGAEGLRVGGRLAIRNEGRERNARGFLAYVWKAKYIPPVVQQDEFFGGEESAPATQAPQPARSTTGATLDAIRNSDHQRSLRRENEAAGFEDEPPF